MRELQRNMKFYIIFSYKLGNVLLVSEIWAKNKNKIYDTNTNRTVGKKKRLY